MNNLRLLTALLAAVLSGVSVCAYAEERVVSLDTLFRIVDLRSRQLKPSLTGMDEAESGLKVAVSGRLPVGELYRRRIYHKKELYGSAPRSDTAFRYRTGHRCETTALYGRRSHGGDGNGKTRN